MNSELSQRFYVHADFRRVTLFNEDGGRGVWLMAKNLKEPIYD